MLKGVFPNRMVCGLFPLTPTLSLGEREKRSQSFGVASAANCSNASGLYEISQRLFLLPWGEGQDEGEAGVNSNTVQSKESNLFKFLKPCSNAS
jgi:hypothetical protein